MAILKSGDLSLDFQYVGFTYGWVDHEFRFLWKGKAIVKDSVLKRDTEHTNNRSKSAFRANEIDKDSFLPILKKVLESNEAYYWEPLEPDVIVGIYPEELFPFLPSNWVILREEILDDDQKAEREAKKKLKKN